MFNLIVDALVREWIRVVLIENAEVTGIHDKVRRLLACFYADDGLSTPRDPELLQSAFNVLTGLFDRTGLRTNIKKTETVTFLPGKIRTCLTEEGYNARVDAQFRKSREGRRVS